jgi:four helix bundle protein
MAKPETRINDEIRMTNLENRYDLEERTAVFGETVIAFAKRIPATPVNLPLISQLVRAATSVGANYCEADDACSKKDFRFKIGICRKESKETKHWLRMVAAAAEDLRLIAGNSGRKQRS